MNYASRVVSFALASAVTLSAAKGKDIADPTNEAEKWQYNFSLKFPPRDPNGISMSLDQMTINLMMQKNGCQDPNPVEALRAWYRSHGVEADVEQTSPVNKDGNGWTSLKMKPKDPKDQKAFDDLTDEVNKFTSLPVGIPMGPKDRERLETPCSRLNLGKLTS